MRRKLLLTGLVCIPMVAADVFTAIRDNDLARIKALTPAELAQRDKSGVTPLLYASAMGNLEEMRILIAAGADVNAADNSGSTPLLWAACDSARVSLLLDHGAKADAKTKSGRTPVMAASACESGVESIRLLLAKGADAKAPEAMIEAAFSGGPKVMRVLLESGAPAGATDRGGFTALMGAAGWDDLALVRSLLAKGANVNAANTFAGRVVHGDIALKKLTALMMAVPFGSPELVKTLLDAGADVNAKDSRGMTPLVFAVSSSNQDVRVVRMLLAKGADVSVVSESGETALDWARKFGVKDVIAELEKAGGKGSPIPAAPVRAEAPLTARAAAEKSIVLLQNSADTYFAKSNCVGCHHQPMAALVVKAAREAGLAVDEKRFDLMKKTMVALLAPRPSQVLAMVVGPAGIDGLSNTTLALAAAGQEPGLLTDSAAAYVAARQTSTGAWEEPHLNARTPMFDSTITVTIYAMRAMQLYAFPSRKAEMDARVAKAREWLSQTKPRTSYERAEVLMGLGWAGADPGLLQKAGSNLAKQQRADGGWSQSPNLNSDAYATGLALRAMREAGVAKQFSAAYEKGVAYLLRTQLDDGSWYVRSRALKLQPYFQSGFPHDHEQWISYVATANATVGLLR